MVELITDSTADLSPELAQKLGVRVLPLSVNFGEESLRDGVDITNAEFYERLRKAETLPTTSQLNPETLSGVFREVLDRGNEAVGIFISSELSGTYQSAVIARDMVDSEDVFVVDSLGVAMSLQLLIFEAVRMRDAGHTAGEIARTISGLREKTRLYAVVDTLKYLKMGGRISSATAVVGGVLGISPIIALKGGRVESAGKARGRKAGIAWLREKAMEEQIDLSYPVVLGHTDCSEVIPELEQAFEPLLRDAPEAHCCAIGSVVGTHIGPGAVGIAYFVK